MKLHLQPEITMCSNMRYTFA
uniref:Uncharacterized protein n=1 Tax=Arundo donax TaxID=35708 RepID=A0A0A8Z0T9_ARUDO